MSDELTSAQLRALTQMDSGEPFEYIGAAGLGKAAWVRMMERLCASGLARKYVHGGYVITDEGRRRLHRAARVASLEAEVLRLREALKESRDNPDHDDDCDACRVRKAAAMYVLATPSGPTSGQGAAATSTCMKCGAICEAGVTRCSTCTPAPAAQPATETDDDEPGPDDCETCGGTGRGYCGPCKGSGSRLVLDYVSPPGTTPRKEGP